MLIVISYLMRSANDEEIMKMDSTLHVNYI